MTARARWICGLLLLCIMTPALADDTPALPPSAEEAMDRLTNSPRHGEWVDVPMGEDEPALRSWVVYPERGDEAPVVIVIHEIFGLTDWVRGVADQLAAEGYVAVAPDLLSGRGPGGGGTEAFEGDAVRAAIRDLEPAEVNRRLDAVRDHAIALPGAGQRTGVIGFCWGGTASFNYAMHQPELDAAVICYGTATSGPEVGTIQAALLGLYGGDDARVNATVPATAAALEQAGKPFAQHTYEGAGHAFFRQQTGRDGANRRATEQGWAQVRTFLREHLER